MNFVQIAFSNLHRRKAKAIFVMLGLAIGITTIVSVYSVIAAMKAEITRQMGEYGANILITADQGELAISYGGISIPDVLFDVGHLTGEDVAAIDRIQSRPMVKAVVPKLLGMVTVLGNEVVLAGSDLQSEFRIKPWLRITNPLARFPDKGKPASAGAATGANAGTKAGASSDASGMGGDKLDLAREDFTRIDLADTEVILGSAVAYTLGVFPSNVIEINGQPFVVKAILEKNGTTDDNQMRMNLAAAQQLLDLADEVTTIELAVDYAAGSEDALLEQIQTMLPDAKVASLRKVMLDRDEILTRLTHFGVAVSILVLLVGILASGIGMAAAVRERTREIGIFRAIGFRKAHIGKIILLEGCVLSLVGGLVGYLAGTLLARTAMPLLAGLALPVPWSPVVLTAAVLLGILVGILASLYPAQLAASLDPAEALSKL